jgi:negative elongation factor C/D
MDENEENNLNDQLATREAHFSSPSPETSSNTNANQYATDYSAPSEDIVSDEDLHIQKECLDLFSSTDFIMEPTIFDTIKTYFMHGGEPGPVVDLLSDNYTAIAQTVNLLAEWLIMTGVSVQEVQLMVENHLRNLIIKHFDPKKADTIFNLEGGVPAWLTEMIEHSIWRKMLYKLAEEHPNCLMLNFTIKVGKKCTWTFKLK